jgi:hypothetical protein
MEAIGIGDLHMTAADGTGGLSKYVEDWDGVILAEAESAIEWGLRRGITNAFFYGDICDAPRMSYTAMIKLNVLFVKYPNINFYLILGNHDMYGKIPDTGHSLELLIALCKQPNVRIFTKPKTVTIDGAKVRFLPYPHHSFSHKALNIFHDEVRGSKNDHGRANNDESLSSSRAVIVGGHLHTAHKIRNTFYSGTLVQNNFGEGIKKYFHHIDFRSATDYSIENVRHKPRYTLHTVILQTRADLKLIPRGETELVKLVVQDGADVSAADWASMSNVVMHKPFKSKEDLQVVLTEDLTEGKELVIRTKDFFKVWIEAADIDETMRKRVTRKRTSILSQVPSDNPRSRRHTEASEAD